MDGLKISHKVNKEAQGNYYPIDFPVPSGVEKVTVSYTYKRLASGAGRTESSTNIIDLGLEDAGGRFLGWSGSARRSVCVGEFESTNGYLTTEIVPGNWKIIVGAYKIESRGVTVHYAIEFTPKSARWFFGDLHLHSDASDGQHGIGKLAFMAKKKGLDFIAVSNHNNYAENLCLPHFPGLTLIPAVEWTHYLGHMNFFGLEVPFRNSFIANSKEQMLQLVNDAKEDGAIVSVNHPKCNFCPYLWNEDTCFDMIEVWNGPMRQVNTRAIRWWTQLMAGGRKIPIVGGSDFHRDFRYWRMGIPVTAVFAKSQSAEDILDAVSKGRGYITSSVNGVKLELQCLGKSFGDTVALGEGAQLEFRAHNTSLGMKLKLVTGGGTTLLTYDRHGRSLSGSIAIARRGFAYIMVTQKVFGRENICAISNPIYFE